MKDCAVIILSAGKSQRMGQPKPFLLFDKTNNITFIEKIITEYQNFGCQEIIIVFNKENKQKFSKLNINKQQIKIITNPEPESGRFYSIKLGLSVLESANYVFLQNCDNPFINQDILKKIFDNKTENAYVSPVYNNKGGHPILIPESIFTKIQTQMSKNLNLKHFLQHFARKNVLLSEANILANINTQEIYNKYFNN